MNPYRYTPAAGIEEMDAAGNVVATHRTPAERAAFLARQGTAMTKTAARKAEQQSRGNSGGFGQSRSKRA